MIWWLFWKKMAEIFEKLGIFVMFIGINVGILYNKVTGFVIGVISVILIGLSILFKWLSR